MKILHLAVEDYSRIPSTLVQEERALGHESYLVVMHETYKQYRQADYYLDLPWIDNAFIPFLKKLQSRDQRQIDNRRRRELPVFSPKGAGKIYFDLRDRVWQPRVKTFLEQVDIHSFDALILDGGSGFLRNASIIKSLKKPELKIICTYYGSDLRTRGIIPDLHDRANARFTFEYDHTLLDPELTFLFYPYRNYFTPKATHPPHNKIRIGHAPTNRAAKGSDIILENLSRLQQHFPMEIVLIENMPYEKAMQLKAGCDIFVDQIGELGYGLNSLEAMSMGIPTAVELQADFEAYLGKHAFININAGNMREKLEPYIKSAQLRQSLGTKGKQWVKTHHAPATISGKIMQALNQDS